MENFIASIAACALLAGTLLTARPISGPLVADQKRDTMLNGEWFLQPVLASDTAAGKYPSIKFDVAKGHFTGHTGCNRMSGAFKRTDSTLIFDERIQVTEMACPGYNETAFLKTLLNTNRIKRDGSVLILMFDQTELSRWTRKPYKAPLSKGT
ncbi:META domain-containing protein [Paraflavitalea pollutisoli]|uniref:META domain-containing protein n=1 Tax=Paraflavitalea pollutisoli TaxID=3034143 RepID=UPI0023EA9248|nr:META domain-containing protein [Paraflavitalea sp. H1-2-19X]